MSNTLPIVLESTTVFKDFFVVQKDRLRYPNDSVHDYFVLHTVKESVAVIATTKHNEIVVTKEYRHAANQELLGCPGGLVDPNETPIQAAERELLEETGCCAKCFTRIGTCFPLPGLLAQTMSVFHAEDVQFHQSPQLETQELIECHLVSIDELKRMLQENRHIDAILCSAFLFYLLNKHASII